MNWVSVEDQLPPCYFGCAYVGSKRLLVVVKDRESVENGMQVVYAGGVYIGRYVLDDGSGEFEDSDPRNPEPFWSLQSLVSYKDRVEVTHWAELPEMPCNAT